jgi:pimeloyl-ACP methyl ester carboxylesterase
MLEVFAVGEGIDNTCLGDPDNAVDIRNLSIARSLKESPSMQPSRVHWFLVGVVLCLYPGAATVQGQSTIRLTNGFELKGSASKMVGLNQSAFAAAAAGKDPASFPIAMIYDGLKRVYVYNRGMIAEVNDSPDLLIRIPLWQQVARSSNEIAAIGSQTTYSNINEYGRRWVNTATPNGPIRILQGITEINARYVQFQGLQTESAYGWDMRVSTSSIPAEAFRRVFNQSVKRTDLDARLDVVNFYIEAERFDEARAELESVIADFPEVDALPKQFQALTQRQAQQIIDEATVRRDAGQYGLALAMWNRFLTVDGIARVKRLEAQDRVTELTDRVQVAKTLLERLREQIAQLPAEQQTGLDAFVDLMASEMTPDTLPRLSDYERLGGEQGIPLGNRVALGIGGWILGAGTGMQNLAVARSLINVRELVYEYLGSADIGRRDAILAELEGEEGAQPEYIQLLLRQLPPPLPLPWPESEPPINIDPQVPAADAIKPDPAMTENIPGDVSASPAGVTGDDAPGDVPPGSTSNSPLDDGPVADGNPAADAKPPVPPAVTDPAVPQDVAPVTPPGYFELEVSTPVGPVQYLVQLPPEYHPLRKYPAILALHPLDASPGAEIDWWAGAYSTEMAMRTGQASRQGYVVVAPKWSRPGQTKYEYTPTEHARVLATLRDVLRHVSVDSDRVFLTGHMAGASAAWDIAVAHPELWAGLVSIGGDADKYVTFYEENARYVPMYFVTGEIAGAPSPLTRNGAVYDKYMKIGYDAMVVMYQGRGDETFYEDINHIFDWMNLNSHRRQMIPREIDAVTMRAGDQFFWWIEMPEILPAVPVHPILFEQEKRKRDAPIVARVADGNTIIVSQVPASTYQILLSPEMGLDMRSPITIRASGRSRTHQFEGKIRYMLEDARRRGDRQHVYWDQVTVP